MLPELLADACTGCMACVNVCPDSALYATAIPESQLAEATRTFFSGERADAEAAKVLAHFADTSKYGRQAAARGLEPAKFGLFVDPSKCKGCAECVAVCPARRAAHDSQGLPMPALGSTVDRPAASWSSSARCPRRRRRIGPMPFSPTSCSASTRSATSAVRDRVRDAGRQPPSG